MTAPIRIQKTTKSRLAAVDFGNLGFGDHFSDHMFSMEYKDGTWRNAEIVPYGPIEMEPGALCLHYGQTVFEGLKAFHTNHHRAHVFRPDMNAKRLSNSCERLCIPRFDHDLFCEAIRLLVQIDQAWIPKGRGQALYIRPLLFATEPHLNVKPADAYRFIIMTAPVRNYYGDELRCVSLHAEEKYTRAAPGGMGFAKTAGNYAATLRPGRESLDKGFDQVLWLDGREHRFVEEVGQMNIMFKIDGKVVTPALRGTILPGVTRDSVITLLNEKNISTEERTIPIDEITRSHESGKLEEAFGVGTAAVITPVGRIVYQDQEIIINKGQPSGLAASLFNQILDIQHGEVDDTHGWNMIVDLEDTAAMTA